MVCVGGGTKAAHFGAALVSNEQKGIEYDEIGFKTARDIGRRVAGLAILLNHSKQV